MNVEEIVFGRRHLPPPIERQTMQRHGCSGQGAPHDGGKHMHGGLWLLPKPVVYLDDYVDWSANSGAKYREAGHPESLPGTTVRIA